MAVNTKAWMTGALTHDYVINYLSNHVEKYSKENNIDNKSLLLVDNAPAHLPILSIWKTGDGGRMAA